MSVRFNADEILQMAERIEKNGIQFYLKAAAATSNPGSVQVFRDLAAMEGEHARTFARMREELTEQERKAAVPDPNQQSTAYLQAWADGHVFDVRTSPAEKLTGKENLAEILRVAMGMEKDSIVFYAGMKEAVPPRLGKARIDAIIQEEMGHLASLSRQLESLRHQML